MMREIREKIARYLASCADLLLPRTCIVCGRKLLTDERHLCLECLTDMPLTYYWQRTHNPMADNFNSAIEDSVEESCEERYSYACALFFFNSDAGYRKIPYQLKYQGNLKAGRFFGSMLGFKLTESPYLHDVDMVIPVPLHWRRRWKRGYNQAEILAKEAASNLDAPLRSDILQRTRNTKTQTALDVSQKTLNVSEAFKVRDPETLARSFPTGKGHILLIDDVFTTGSTLHACFVALRKVLPPSVRISVATLGFVGGS